MRMASKVEKLDKTPMRSEHVPRGRVVPTTMLLTERRKCATFVLISQFLAQFYKRCLTRRRNVEKQFNSKNYNKSNEGTECFVTNLEVLYLKS